MTRLDRARRGPRARYHGRGGRDVPFEDARELGIVRPQLMLTEAEFRSKISDRSRRALPWVIAAAACPIVYFVVAILAERYCLAPLLPTPRPWWLGPLLVLPAFLAFGIAAAICDRMLCAVPITCPKCEADLARRVGLVLLSRRCPSCGTVILSDGTPRSLRVCHRHRRIRQMSLLATWMWAWPAISAGAILLHHLDPSAFEACPTVAAGNATIGAVLSGWTLVRTGQLRFAPPMAASCVMLAWSLWRFGGL